MRYAADIVQQKELAGRSTALVALALARDTRLYDNTERAFRAKGWSRYATKSVDPVLAGDPGIDEAPLRSALLAQITAASLAGRITGALRLSLTDTARLMVGQIVAVQVGEADPKPVGRLDFALANQQPIKLVAEMVASLEAMRSFNETTQAGIAAKLTSTCIDADDVALVDVLTAGSPVASASVGDLLSAISNGSPRQPHLIADYAGLFTLAAGTIRDLEAIGVTILTSPAAAGRLIVVDGSGLLISQGDIEVRTARHAMVNLGGSPSVPDLSLWQANLVSLRAERFVRYAVRPDAVAYANVGSPA